MPTPDPNAPTAPATGRQTAGPDAAHAGQAPLSLRQRQLLELGARIARSIGRGAGAISSRRGMTTVLVGVVLLVVAWVGERDSAWGFPMLAIGGLLIFFGLMGPRLSGSFSLQWGDDGAVLELRSAIAPTAQRRHPAPALPMSGTAPEMRAAARQGPSTAEKPGVGESEQIEGSAETIEFRISPLGDGPATGERRASEHSGPESEAAAS